MDQKFLEIACRPLMEEEKIHHLMLITLDGHILHHQGNMTEAAVLSISSLSVGLILAGKQIGKSAGFENSKGENSYQTEGFGVEVVPVLDDLFLVSAHRDHSAPGRVRFKTRNLAHQLSEKIGDLPEQGKNDPKTGGTLESGVSTHQPLFKNLQDSEVDKLFDF